MQTSAIHYRVADFLKQYPPFQYMPEEELLALAGRGRVKFHEADEFIVWQDAPHLPFIFVIQQGTVSLWRSENGAEQLRDMRGAGDLLGIDRFNGAPVSGHSAKSATDVVIYALPAAMFGEFIDKHPQAKKYVAAHGSVAANYTPQDARRGAHETMVFDIVPRTAPPVCAPGNTIRQAARRLSQAGAEAIAVVDGDNRVVGMLSAEALLKAVAEDSFDASRAVSSIMNTAPHLLAADVTVSQCVLSMEGDGLAAITQNGALVSLVTARSLEPAFGDHPSVILREIPRAASPEALRVLNQRARAFALDALTSPAAIDWLAQWLSSVDAAILQRVAALVPPPAGDSCWCLYAAAGRGESMTAAQQRAAVILGDGADPAAFRAWYDKTHASLAACGYVQRPGHFDTAFSVASLAEWRDRFTGWIAKPLESPLYDVRPLFDMRPVLGNAQLWRDLETPVRGALTARPAFVSLLANDCLERLPPLTFFRDAVVGESGETSAMFDLRGTALQPLVDAARVFGITAGHALGGSTLERYRSARTLLPEQESIFRDAAETFRVVLYQQARAGIRQGDDGGSLNPALLSHHDRQILKSGFRSILKLLEFTAEGDWMSAA